MGTTSAHSSSLRKAFQVSSADTDMFGRLRLGGLCNFLIQSAISSADTLGFGLKYLQQENLLWVLSRLEVHILKKLRWRSNIYVETWPKVIDGIFYIRDFIVKDFREDIVAKSTSGWLAIDILKRRPKIIKGIAAEKFCQLQHMNAIESRPEKLLLISGGENRQVQTTFFDIDLNKHVTTVRYIDWIMDFFSVDFHEKHYPSSFKINFLKETVLGEAIDISKISKTDKIFHFEGKNISANKQAFRAELEF